MYATLTKNGLPALNNLTEQSTTHAANPPISPACIHSPQWHSFCWEVNYTGNITLNSSLWFFSALSYHHQFLLLFMEHRASMKSLQTLWSPVIPLTSFHDLPIFLISSSIVLCHVLFGLPLLLYPWGFQSNAVFSIAPASLHNVCPIQFQFLLFIWISIGFCLVIPHYSFVILSVHFIFIIRLKHLFINVCSLVIWLVVFQVSQAYNNTDFTFCTEYSHFNSFWYVVISPYRIQLNKYTILHFLGYLH